MTRSPRSRTPRGRSWVGERFTADVGPVAHGGHCVSRLPDGRVVFVRHAIPGERVVLEVTEGTDGDRFWRADAVEVVSSSADRVEAPCPVAGPGLCGGCDFQHVSLAPAARAQGRGRRRAAPPAGRARGPCRGRGGARRRRRAALAHPRPLRPPARRSPRHAQAPLPRAGARRRLPDRGARCRVAVRASRRSRPPVRRHDFAVAEDGFWQVHPGAPRVLVETVLDLLDPAAGGAGARPVRRRRAVRGASWPTASAPTASSAVEGHPGAARRRRRRTCPAAYACCAVTSAESLAATPRRALRPRRPRPAARGRSSHGRRAGRRPVAARRRVRRLRPRRSGP